MLLKEVLLKNDFIRNGYWDLKTNIYNRQGRHREKEAKRRIYKKLCDGSKINIVLIASRKQTWFFDELFILLSENQLFSVTVIVSPFVKSGKEEMIHYAMELSNELTEKQIPFLAGYDTADDKYIDLCDSIQPDIAIFTTNWEYHAHPYFHMKHFDKSLNYIVSYAMHVVDNKGVYASPANYLCYKEFLPDGRLIEVADKYRKTSKGNYAVTGSPKLDRYTQDIQVKKDPWKKDHKHYKRIIWAPHFSFEDTGDVYVVASFYEICDYMIELAREYSDRAEFVFKPHPLLRHELEKHWSIEKIDSYYCEWDSMDNTQFFNGSYADLFLTSDAMIFDSISFIVEYLFTLKPALYTVCKNAKLTFNSFGMDAFDRHYHTKNIKEDIKRFIDNVILNESDPLMDKRKEFVSQFLNQNNKKSSQMIYDIINDDLNDIKKGTK